GKFGSLAGQSLSHSLKLGVQVSDLTLDVANGAAQATHSGFQAKAANRQADVQESRADLTTLQGVIERLKEELSRMLEAFQEIMERIFAMLQAKGETLHNLSSRPAAI
ncbi:hypothetical protein C0046_11645, partial [Pseudomonas aeruginosa]